MENQKRTTRHCRISPTNYQQETPDKAKPRPDELESPCLTPTAMKKLKDRTRSITTSIKKAYYQGLGLWSTHHEVITTAEEFLTALQNTGIL